MPDDYEMKPAWPPGASLGKLRETLTPSTEPVESRVTQGDNCAFATERAIEQQQEVRRAALPRVKSWQRPQAKAS